jgi:hypothetical protein
VGNLNTKRESAAAVALPNGLTLIVGGQSCGAATFGSSSGFECTALQTSELYNETSQTFSVAGSGSGGLMTVARSGPTATLISGSGTALDGQVLIVGGSTGSSYLSLPAIAPGAMGSPLGQQALHSAELYNPATDAFTATNSIPACPAGHSYPPVAPATCLPGDTCDCTNALPSVCVGPTNAISTVSESGTTVTITMSSANPTGLTIGNNVTVSNVSVTGYNGTFVVTAIPSSTTFQYTAASGLAGGTGGTAAANTFECGMVDQGAALIPNDGGKVLLAGGDLVQFLGESSTLSFIFDPSTQNFTRTTGTLTTPRELFPLVAMDPAVVSGPLSGHVVAFGGVEGNSAFCTVPGQIVDSTLGNAEVFDPSSQTWSVNGGASAPITSTSESGSTVTVTSAANPAGLVVGQGVTIAGVTCASCPVGTTYNGSFPVASIPSSTTFTYTANASTLTAGTGGTAQAGTMGERRAAVATLIEAGSDTGEVILPGGVDVEAGTLPSTCVVVTNLKQRASAETDLYNPETGTLGTFTATGSLNQAREGAGQGVLGAGTDLTDVLVVGGACTTPTPSLQSVTIGSSGANVTCGTSGAVNDYSELYSQSTKMWTVGPGPASGFTPTNAAASAVLP